MWDHKTFYVLMSYFLQIQIFHFHFISTYVKYFCVHEHCQYICVYVRHQQRETTISSTSCVPPESCLR